MKKVMIFLVSLILTTHLAISLSNEALGAKSQLEIAQKDFDEMQSRGIPLLRVNETLQEALQIYAGQISLENSGKTAKYDTVIKLCEEISSIKAKATLAQDELKVFEETYQEYSQELDLSSIEQEYQEILSSFQDERFEDTVKLIEEGYNLLSEVQSEQTAIKLFYKATSNTLKNFFIKYWAHLSIILIVFGGLFFIFKKAISIVIIKRKIKNLEFQKQNLNYLIKIAQKNYFELKKISQLEYEIKVNKFEKMILDINRQIPLLREEIAKIRKKKIELEDLKEEKEILNKTKKIEKRVKKTIKKEIKKLDKHNKNISKRK